VPLLWPLSSVCNPRKRALLQNCLLRSKKGKGKAKAYVSDKSLYVNNSEVESSSGSSHLRSGADKRIYDFLLPVSDDYINSILPPAAAATAQLSPGKCKTPEPMSPTHTYHVQGKAKTPSAASRKRSRAQSHSTPEENASDNNAVPQSKLSSSVSVSYFFS